MKVINYGSLNWDYVYQVPHMVREGETLAAYGMETFLGGKGLNQSIALARAGVSVLHGGCVGEDGDGLISYLKTNGVDTSGIEKVEEKSGHTIIQVDSNGQNCILLYGGANQKQKIDHIKAVLDQGNPGDYLVLQNEVNEIEYIMQAGKEQGMRLVINPSPIDPAILKAPLGMADYLLVNEIEGQALTGASEPDQMMKTLRTKYPNTAILLTLGEEGAWYEDGKQSVRQKAIRVNGASEPDQMMKTLRTKYPNTAILLTLGEEGAWYEDGKQSVRQKAIRVKAVDTTAAGDTFTGYFIAGLMEGYAMEHLLYRCAAASALAVSRNGASASIPQREEVETFLRSLDV